MATSGLRMFRLESLRVWSVAVEYGKDLYDVADGLPR